MKRIALGLFLLHSSSFLGWAAWAVGVEGFGSITTNHPTDPSLVQIDTPYADPVFLNVGKSVQLVPSQLNGAGSKTMSYSGQAQFGRLGVTSFVGGTHQNMPDLHGGSDIFVSFEDKITPQGLNALASNYLRLDVDLSGLMARVDQTFGNSTVAIFEVTMLSLDGSSYKNTALIEFSWFGDTRITSNTSNDGFDTPRFKPYANGEPSFSPAPGSGANFSFGAHGYVDLPLNEDEGFDGMQIGEAFLLEVVVSAHSGTTTSGAVSDTNFGNTALIGNARFVNGSGNPIVGASFTSESGYDYITPPGALTVPEPATCAMLLAGVSSLLLRRRPRIAS